MTVGRYVEGFGFMEDGKHFLTASQDKTIRAWHLGNCKQASHPLHTNHKAHRHTDTDTLRHTDTDHHTDIRRAETDTNTPVNRHRQEYTAKPITMRIESFGKLGPAARTHSHVVLRKGSDTLWVSL